MEARPPPRVRQYIPVVRTQRRMHGSVCTVRVNPKVIRHRVKDFLDCLEDERSRLLKVLAEERANDGPSKSTSSQSVRKNTTNPGSVSFGKGTISRIKGSGLIANVSDTLSCKITISDGQVSLIPNGRCDDGSDDSIVSAKLAQRAAIKGIYKIEAIKWVRLQVALKAGDEAQQFIFSRSLTSPSTVLYLSVVQSALENVTLLVDDDELPYEICSSVFRYCSICRSTRRHCSNRTVLLWMEWTVRRWSTRRW